MMAAPPGTTNSPQQSRSVVERPLSSAAKGLVAGGRHVARQVRLEELLGLLLSEVDGDQLLQSPHRLSADHAIHVEAVDGLKLPHDVGRLGAEDAVRQFGSVGG